MKVVKKAGVKIVIVVIVGVLAVTNGVKVAGVKIVGVEIAGAKIPGVNGVMKAIGAIGRKRTVVKVAVEKAVVGAREEVVVDHLEEVPAAVPCRSVTKSTMKKKFRMMVFTSRPLMTSMTWSTNSWKATALLLTTYVSMAA